MLNEIIAEIILLQGSLRIAFWWIDSGSGFGFRAPSKCRGTSFSA